MVVVSFFTKKVPRDELGGLTWPTINDPPISHGAIGEEAECERIENGNARVAGNSDGIELLKKGENTRCSCFLFSNRVNETWTIVMGSRNIGRNLAFSQNKRGNTSEILLLLGDRTETRAPHWLSLA